MVLEQKKKSLKYRSPKKKNPPQEFNPFGLHDVLHYIKREIGVDLFSKNNVIETKLKLFL